MAIWFAGGVVVVVLGSTKVYDLSLTVGSATVTGGSTVADDGVNGY